MEQNYRLNARSEAFNNVIHQTDLTTIHHQQQEIEAGFERIVNLCETARSKGRAIYLVGNGGSAAVASHALTDFVNVARLRAFILHESSLITCMSNDFGYDQAFKRIVNTVFRENDILIAISSSGKSLNICNAAKMAKALGGYVITLSGFLADNPLRKLGDLNFWLNSTDYGLVEIGHLFLLHNLADRCAHKLKIEQHATESLNAFATT